MFESLSKDLRGTRGAAQRMSDGRQGGVCVYTYINVCVVMAEIGTECDQRGYDKRD